MRWPPTGLGVGTPANLALLSPKLRAQYVETAAIALVSGMLTVGLMAALDQLVFAGASVERIRAVARLSFAQRLLIVAFSALTEELVYRLGIATAVAALVYVILRKSRPHAASISMWVGLLAAATLFGLAHAANLPNVAHPYIRALVLNGLAGIVLGTLYWYKGLEAAVLAHLAADTTIYLLLASFL
jgi:hypothetical protein